MKSSSLIQLFCLLPTLLSGEISSSVSSKHAAYDGNALILNEDVKLNHAMGIMQANFAKLIKEKKDQPFSKIHLDDRVCITLHDRGRIFCSAADFDMNALTGHLTSSAFVSKDGTFFPLSIASESADLKLTKLGDQLELAEITATGNVTIGYGSDFTLTTADAKYVQDSDEPCVFAPNPCHLTHNKDEISAKSIAFYPDTSKFALEEPEGDLAVSFLPKAAPLHFSSDSLTWDEQGHALILKDNIIISQEGFGTLTCDNEIELKHTITDGKWLLQSIKSRGKTQWQFASNEAELQKLICYGPIHLNQSKNILTLKSPGKMQQIEYYHDNLKLLADQMKMKYLQTSKKIHPKSVLLKGNIRLSKSNDPEELQCAVADQFSYHPESQTIILSAKERQKVLFWDATQDLAISAAEVHITKGADRDYIRGVGNVRLMFSSTENALLKKLFPFYRPSGGAL